MLILLIHFTKSHKGNDLLSTVITTTDKLALYLKAILRLQNEGLLSKGVEHRVPKYLSNILEEVHGALKRVIQPTRSFQPMETAAAVLKGSEIIRMIRCGHCTLRERHATGEARLVNQLSALAA